MNIVIVQARSSSSRLPGKVMLPLGGVPLAVLVARRAASTGRRVVVATSDEPSDDGLASVLSDHGVAFCRGLRDDVLARFAGALGDLPDAATVVRLTADNPFPNGELIDEVEAEFDARDVDYITTTGARSGLPFGVSVEITRAGLVRAAARAATDPSDREHVTPWIRVKAGAAVFTGRSEMGMSHFRATVDCFDDYVSVTHVFDGCDPFRVPWSDLVARLRGAPFQPSLTRPARDFVLGTAQLGLDYGIAGSPRPTEEERQQMLRLAAVNGAGWVDTAHAYGDSEAVIGRFLAAGWRGRIGVVTKLSPLADLDPHAAPETAAARAEASVFRSCAALGAGRIDRLLLHRADHLEAWGAAVFERLQRLRRDGVVGALGVSVQSPAELDRALDCPDVAHVQLPANLVDYRWDASLPRLEQRRRQRDLTVHLRSPLLQGLLACADPALWHRAHVQDASEVTAWLARWRDTLGRRSFADLCISWARAQPWADGVVVGCDTPAQLRETLGFFDGPPLEGDVVAAMAADRPVLPEATLNPATWAPAR